MDPMFLVILAMITLGCSQIVMSYGMQRAERNARNMGDMLCRLAAEAGWKVEADNDTGEAHVVAPSNVHKFPTKD